MRTIVNATLVAFALVGCKKNEPEPESKTDPPAVTHPAQTVASTDSHGIPAPSNVAEPPPDAVKSESGLISQVLQPGAGSEHPQSTDRVKVHYTGWTHDGKIITSTLTRNRPHTLSVERLQGSWEGEALSDMVEGEKRRFWVAPDLARGGMSRRASKGVPMTFDITLVDIIEVPEPPKVPEDIAAPPKDAKRTKSGIAYKVLAKGTGTVHPKPDQKVEVHYTGWTTDGKMFDSSIPRGRTSTFSLNQVIKGWTEGVQLMVAGEKTRFWIPGPLAYGDKPKRPGAPAGMLVFDIELVRLR